MLLSSESYHKQLWVFTLTHGFTWFMVHTAFKRWHNIYACSDRNSCWMRFPSYATSTLNQLRKFSALIVDSSSKCRAQAILATQSCMCKNFWWNTNADNCVSVDSHIINEHSLYYWHSSKSSGLYRGQAFVYISSRHRVRNETDKNTVANAHKRLYCGDEEQLINKQIRGQLLDPAIYSSSVKSKA